MDNNFRPTIITAVVFSIIVSSIFGAVAGYLGALSLSGNNEILNRMIKQATGRELVLPVKTSANGEKVVTVNEESAIISAVENASPSVVSIIITKDLPIIDRNIPFNNDFFRQFFGDQFDQLFDNPSNRGQGPGTQETEVGGGSGFLVSTDGYVVTNRHVVEDTTADYTVLTNDGTKHPAKVLARDTINDLAILKIDGNDYKSLNLGDSANLKAGQTVIAIGNALGEFRNTVSTGVISGLARSITAGSIGFGSEDLTGVIQTDASINPGNSGGPLLNIAGQVIGINTAIAQGAQNIGFAIPINQVKKSIESVKLSGRIVRPWLGVRYTLITPDLAKQNKLNVDYGALIARGQNPTEIAVVPGSPADKAGLVENDIILEINGQKINENEPLPKIISQFNIGDQITAKIMHDGQTKEIKITLEEMK